MGLPFFRSEPVPRSNRDQVIIPSGRSLQSEPLDQSVIVHRSFAVSLENDAMGEMTLKSSPRVRRATLATLFVSSTILATGCSSGVFPLASVSPFDTSRPASPSATSKLSESFASTTKGARNQISTMGTSVKQVWGKTTGKVAGVFNRNRDPLANSDSLSPDPLRLDDNPRPIGPEVFVANGQMWETSRNFSKAMESYVVALEREADHVPALTSIARLHFRQGNHDQAAEFYRRAIAQSPEDAGLHNELGRALSQIGDGLAAIESFDKALKLAPGMPRYANDLASEKFAAGDTTSAYDVLQKNNKPAVAHFNMAYLHFKKGQMDQSRSHLTEAIRFEPQAAGDAAVKRAVDRSRDMLAQISGSESSAVHARIASLPTSTTIQQTSQALSPGSPLTVKPASSIGPTKTTPASSAVWQSNTAPAVPAAKVGGSGVRFPAATGPVTSSSSSAVTIPVPSVPVPAVTVPMLTGSNASAPTVPASVGPASVGPASTGPASTGPVGSSPGAEAPAVPFSLPTGFSLPSGG